MQSVEEFKIFRVVLSPGAGFMCMLIFGLGVLIEYLLGQLFHGCGALELTSGIPIRLYLSFTLTFKRVRLLEFIHFLEACCFRLKEYQGSKFLCC